MDKTPVGSLEPSSDDDETSSGGKRLEFSRAGSVSNGEGDISRHETDILEEDKYQGSNILDDILSRSKQYFFHDCTCCLAKEFPFSKSRNFLVQIWFSQKKTKMRAQARTKQFEELTA